MNEDELRTKLAQYKFYHVIPLTENVRTPGNPNYISIQKLVLEAIRKVDFKGKRVLDIGCRDGLFSFEAEKMGSAEVVGIDNDLSKAAVEFLIPYFGSGVKMHEMNLYDLTPDTFGLFDIIIFAGVLYHLRYPFWALRIIRDVLKENGTVIIETALYRGDRHRAMLYCPIGQDSPYERTSCTFFNEKGLRDTMRSLGFKFEIGGSRSQLEKKASPMRHVFAEALRFLQIRMSIYRAAFIYTVSAEIQEKEVKDYWEGIHDIHTRIGG